MIYFLVAYWNKLSLISIIFLKVSQKVEPYSTVAIPFMKSRVKVRLAPPDARNVASSGSPYIPAPSKEAKINEPVARLISVPDIKIPPDISLLAAIQDFSCDDGGNFEPPRDGPE